MYLTAHTTHIHGERSEHSLCKVEAKLRTAAHCYYSVLLCIDRWPSGIVVLRSKGQVA